MTYIAKPKLHHPSLVKNKAGYTRRDYEGAVSTLCAGCGHDSISAAIIQACYELDILPHQVAKLSGIGCSSKAPTYFVGASHGFNTVHGRMPSVMTGANLANKDLIYMGVSGDGDSASIGLGQFAHVMRRGVNMTYIVMNNGVYGLTKGQFSATADKGSISKKGVANSDEAIDMVSLAILMGATFVGRSFSGDKHQLVPLIKAAMEHKGAAFLDVVSPCVAFNNHAGSTKSYEYVREHNEALNRLDFIEGREEITTEYDPGTVTTVQQHDGSFLRLRKLGEEYDASDKVAAMKRVQEGLAAGEVVTGLLYLDPTPQDLHHNLNTVDVPLSIDSSIVAALEAGLAVYKGKPLVNSVTGEEERLEQVLPLVKKYNAAVVAISNDETGISEDPDVRYAVAKKIVERAADYGIPREDIVVDPLVMPVGAINDAGRRLIYLLRRLREELKVNTTCGASNFSFGLPNRRGLNAAFLPMMIGAGMTSAIMNPLHLEDIQAILGADVVMGNDPNCGAWIRKFREPAPEGAAAEGARGRREGGRRRAREQA